MSFSEHNHTSNQMLHEALAAAIAAEEVANTACLKDEGDEEREAAWGEMLDNRLEARKTPCWLRQFGHGRT